MIYSSIKKPFMILLWVLSGITVMLIVVNLFFTYIMEIHQYNFENIIDIKHKPLLSGTANLTNTVSKPFNDSYLCDLKCKTGVPCVYLDEVDFRIIVITYKRPMSLSKCLNHISNLDTVGDRVSVEVWIDRSKKGQIHQPTLNVAKKFQHSWNKSGKGRACVHLQDRNAFIGGQWIDTWRPKPGTKEICLILEDDVDIAPVAYRWLKAVHSHYGHRSDIMGYALATHKLKFFAGNHSPLKAPQQFPVFMYGALGSWGFAPHPVTWSLFQDWVHVVKAQKKFKPYIKGILPTVWYKILERGGRQESMWTMWHMYFSHQNNLYCIYSNLPAYTNRSKSLLSFNRFEFGLHFGPKSKLPVTDRLIEKWNDSYVRFPNFTIQFHYDGSVARMVPS